MLFLNGLTLDSLLSSKIKEAERSLQHKLNELLGSFQSKQSQLELYKIEKLEKSLKSLKDEVSDLEQNLKMQTSVCVSSLDHISKNIQMVTKTCVSNLEN